MMIVQNAKLNLIPGAVLPRINVTQYDYGSRSLKFEIWNGSQRFTLANGMSARIQGTKPDRFGFDYAATVDVSNNLVVCNLTQQMTAAYGDCVCEIVLTKTGERIGTLNFVLDIQPAGLNNDTVVSDSELPDIISQATEQMENSEAWAVGTKNGTAVPSTAPQYHNNAKYYAESIGTYGHDAEAWAIGERGGTPVGSSDPTYHNNSKYYSQQAGTSATNAGNAATRAEASAATAVAASSHPPYIGANGDWYVWNTNSSQYVDSGVDASITVQIADITMLAAGATPYVTNTGTDTDPIFHLFIPAGKGITNITKTGTSGLTDTYTITYNDGTTTTYTVVNGNGISGISKTSTSGLVDTYTISYTNGNSVTYTVTNGKGISSITKTGTSGLVDTYTIAYNSGSPTTFQVTNGKTAYQSAVAGGYTGTEQDFETDLANFETWATNAASSASDASDSATAAANSATSANQSYLDAKAQADRAQAYADFVEPHFVIENNRLYIKDDAVGEFITANNRLYIKLAS